MRAIPFFIVWAISFVTMALFANSMSEVFWIAFAVFAGCSVYATDHKDRLLNELDE